MQKKFVILLILGLFLFIGVNNSYAEWVSPGKLAKAHKELEGIDNCLKCHSLVEGITDSACNACHEKLLKRINAKKGFHANVKGKCFECHTDHKGDNYDIVWIEKEKFDHKMTGYVLRDKHKLPCQDCHKQNNTYLDLTSDKCLQCHTDVHKKTASEDCISCHNIKGWKEVTFDHDKDSEYKLTGKHAEVKCGPCHYKNPIQEKETRTDRMYRVIKFKPLNYQKCDDCHTYVHKEELKDNKCTTCHVTKSWEVTSFNHNDPRLSDYKLTGRHKNVSCILCHPEEKSIRNKDGKDVEIVSMKIKPLEYALCINCHYDVHMEQFEKQDCDTCHPLKSRWKDITFKHESSKYMGYKLENIHKDVTCDKCHEQSEIRYTEFGKEKKAFTGLFKPIESKKCNDCHYDVHLEQFGKQECDDCHPVNNDWKDFTFKHESPDYKGYKLEGKHIKVECDKCHKRSETTYTEFKKEKKALTAKYKPVESSRCDDCHKDDHKGKYKQIAKVQQITCENCHSVEKDWKVHEYEHRSKSNYHKYTERDQTREFQCDACHVCSTDIFCITCCFENYLMFR